MSNKLEVQNLTSASHSDEHGDSSAESSGALLELVRVLRKDKELYEAK